MMENLKKSTRIALAVSIVWAGFMLFEMANGRQGILQQSDAFLSLILGLIVFWAVKFVLGSMIDKK